jgi:hypothetical protein
VRRKIVDRVWSRGRVEADVLSLGCVDLRVEDWQESLGRYMGFSKFLPITIPGGVKDLVYPKDPRDAEHLLEIIDLIVSHYPKIRLVGMAHNECLACDHRADPDFYEDILLKARRIFQRRFPAQERFLVYLDFDGGMSLVEE